MSRKAVGFIICFALLAGAMLAAGCKPRNIRQLIMPYVPGPAPVSTCELSGSYTFGSNSIEFPVEGPAVTTFYPGCKYTPDPQRIYEIQVTEGGYWFSIYGYDFDGPYVLSLRSSCEPTEEDVVFCGEPNIYFGSGFYMEPGTYYLVVMAPSDEIEGWVRIYWD